MSNPEIPEVDSLGEVAEPAASFDAILSEYEQSHQRRSGEDRRQIDGTVVAVDAEFVFVDIGYKTEGVLPVALFEGADRVGIVVEQGDLSLRQVLLDVVDRCRAADLHEMHIGRVEVVHRLVRLVLEHQQLRGLLEEIEDVFIGGAGDVGLVPGDAGRYRCGGFYLGRRFGRA